MRARITAFATCLLLLSMPASAQQADAGAMCRAAASNRATAIALIKNLQATIRLFDRLDFATRESLADAKALLADTPGDAEALRCAEALLAGKELRDAMDLQARVPAWACGDIGATRARGARSH